MNNIKKAVSILLFLIVFFGLITNSTACIDGVSKGLDICLRVIIPSLFVFTVCSLCLLRFCGTFIGSLFAPVLSPIFNISTAGVLPFLLGLLGGYPIGAKLTAELYLSGKLEKGEAERLLSFCNNAGPMFIIGAVGSGFLGNAKTGAMLYIIHILSAVTVGIVTGIFAPPVKKINYLDAIKKEWDSVTVPPFFSLVTDSAKDAVRTMSVICANILLFQAVISILNEMPLFAVLPPVLSNGLLELSSGVAVSTGTQLVSLSFILSFGGLCIHMQTESVLSKSGLDTKRYYVGKMCAAVFSAVYTKLFMVACVVPVFSPSQHFAPISVQGLSLVFAMFLFFVIISVVAARKLASLMHR